MRERFDGHGGGLTWALGTRRTIELHNSTAERMALPKRDSDLKQRYPARGGACLSWLELANGAQSMRAASRIANDMHAIKNTKRA